jgi:hypothetical protein
MTKREKVLAFAVFGILGIVLLQFGFVRYRAAIKKRENQIATLLDQVSDRTFRQMEGTMAEVRMNSFTARSLPSDVETARSIYTQYLTELGFGVSLASYSAKYTGVAVAPGVYTQLNYSLQGEGNLSQLIELLHKFHSKNYLHRIVDLTVGKKIGGGLLTIKLEVQALALDDASTEATSPEEPAGRVNPELDYYRSPILNRNPLAPPNRPPSFAADKSPKAIVGEMMNYAAKFNDPDSGQKLTYSIVGTPPEGIKLDASNGTISLKPDAVGELEVLISVTDDGWPRMTSEEKIVFKIVEPPPEEAPEPEKPKFDEATQTFLTGLTQSRGRWMAMLHVRTKGETLKLLEGDEFEIGQLKGIVVEVTQKFAVIESDGERFVLTFDTSLADAKTNAAP